MADSMAAVALAAIVLIEPDMLVAVFLSIPSSVELAVVGSEKLSVVAHVPTVVTVIEV